MTKISLQALADDEFTDLIDLARKNYARELYEFGEATTPARGRKFARKEIETYERDKSSAHHIFHLQVDEQRVGYLWYIYPGVITKPYRQAFLNFIMIYPEFRRRGYATQALEIYEQRIKELDAQESVFYVFRTNFNAIKLYQKCGYTIWRPAKFYDAKKATRYYMGKRWVDETE